MRKALVMVITLCMIASFSACSQSATPAVTNAAVATTVVQEATSTPTATPVSKKDVTITGFFPQTWITDIDRTLATQFEAATGIKVDLQSVPDDQWMAVLSTKLNAGDATDFFAVHGGSNALKSKIDPQQNCLDLSDQPWVSRYDSFIKNNLVTLPDDGKVYGFFYYCTPKTATWNLLYNPDLFKEVGAEVPTTFDEFKAVCAKLKNAGYTPLFIGAADGWNLMLPLMHCGTFITQDPQLYDKLNKNQIKFADLPEMEKACDQFKELADLGYFGSDYLANSFTQGEAALINKKAAMLFCDVSTLSSIIKNNPGKGVENWRYFVMPLLDNQTITCPINGETLFVNKNTKHKDETLQYLSFLATKENLTTRMQARGLPDTGFTDTPTNYNPALKELFDKYTATPIGSVQTSVNYVEVQYFDAQKDFVSFLMGKMTAKQFLKGIDNRRAEQAKAEKNPYWK